MSDNLPKLEAELIYNQKESERTLAAQLDGPAPGKTWAMRWLEAIAVGLSCMAAMTISSDLVGLSSIDRVLLVAGFVVPLGYLISRLARAEKRLQALIQLLRSNGTLNP